MSCCGFINQKFESVGENVFLYSLPSKWPDILRSSGPALLGKFQIGHIESSLKRVNKMKQGVQPAWPIRNPSAQRKQKQNKYRPDYSYAWQVQKCCFLPGRKIEKVWYIHILEYYITVKVIEFIIWLVLKNIKLNG